ncbi:hypothetical protein IWQ62_004948 [Dispira parvispora]|uniref:tRNA(Ile)-lysidine synthetase n=1 Tax=Dispira parvispora TaxID=1520584 RepID=A0A9W8AKN4_9FUNG|nr:hypothetical protein IWQ62_004948 [Dispira parvispora]
MQAITSSEFAAVMKQLGLSPKRRYGNVVAFTVDHQYRPESADEARRVGSLVQDFDVQHEIITIPWQHPTDKNVKLPKRSPWALSRFDRGVNTPLILPDPKHMEEEGRFQRYRLLAQACEAHKLSLLFTGHHRGDQAETMLFRFLRESGLDGLAGISASYRLPSASSGRPYPVRVIRPLLPFSKERLKATCYENGITWVEDPSNQSTLFTRNLLRKEIGRNTVVYDAAKETLSSKGRSSKTLIEGKMSSAAQTSSVPDLGTLPAEFSSISPHILSEGVLLRVCRHMQQRRCHADKLVEQILHRYVEFNTDIGAVLIRIPRSEPESNEQNNSSEPFPRWWANPTIMQRVLIHLARWVSGSPYPPGLSAALDLHQSIVRDTVKIHRGEPASVFHSRHGQPSPHIISLAIAFPYFAKSHSPAARYSEHQRTARWFFCRKPFSIPELPYCRLPVPVSQGKPEWVLWTNRFFISITLKPNFRHLYKSASDSSPFPNFYVREFQTADVAELRRIRPQLVTNPTLTVDRPGVVKRAVAALDNIPLLARFSIPVIVIRKDNDKDILLCIPTLRLYRRTSLLDQFQFSVKFARPPLSNADEWEFRKIDALVES